MACLPSLNLLREAGPQRRAKRDPALRQPNDLCLFNERAQRYEPTVKFNGDPLERMALETRGRAPSRDRRIRGADDIGSGGRVWRVAVLDDYQGIAQQMADWGRLGPDVEVRMFRDHLDDADALVARLEPFQAVVAMRERTPFAESLLARLPALRLLVTTGMANASIDLPAATRLGILVSGTRSLGHPTAELTWGLILALARSIPQEDQAVRRGEWQTTLGESLDGKTLGVIGLGNLGSRVAAIGRAFGMAVIAWSENLSAERAAECGAEHVAKDALLTGADVVTVHLRLSARTRGLIGARELRLMKPTSYLVNTSRGPIVDEGALLDAITRGAIAGAGLDVFDDEPLPAGHPFRRQANVIVTPHLGYVTRDTYRVFYGDAVEDLRAFLDGHPVRVLNPDVQTSRR